MGVTVCLPLFGNPGHELEEGATAKSQELRTLADALRERLVLAADTLDKLTADGWAAEVAMFDLILSHPRVATKEQAEQRIRSLGTDPEPFLIIEDVEEEEDPS
jgi:hypothetical protein